MKIVFLICILFFISFAFSATSPRPDGVPAHYRLIEKQKGFGVWMDPKDMEGKECGKEHSGYMDITDFQNLGLKAVPTVKKKKIFFFFFF